MKIKNKVHEIDFKYRAYLKKICISSLELYRGVPLSWEDIYNNFLFEAPTILEEYKEDSELTERTFLGIRCKYFALNYCRSFQTNKHRIMNGARTLDVERTSVLSDVEPVSIKVDTSVLSDEELELFNQHFLAGISLNEIARKKDQTDYAIRKRRNKVKSKLASQIKN